MSWMGSTIVFVVIVSAVCIFPTALFARWRGAHAADEIREPSKNGCAARATLRLNGSAGEASELVRQSFEAIGARVRTPVRPEQVCATRGLNVRTTGEILTAWVLPASDGSTEIRLESCPTVPVTMADWGRNRSNVKLVAEELGARAAVAASATEVEGA